MPPELENSVIVDNDHPDTPQADIAAISELISPPAADESEQQEAPAPEPEQPPPEMAEAEEIDTAEPEAEPEPERPQIDYDMVLDMVVPMRNADPVTIGTLKDFYDKNRDLQQERDDWEAHQSEQQLELMTTRNKLIELANSLQNVPPEAIEQAEKLMQFNDQREQQLLATAFPQWDDADKKAAARAEHLELIQHYGFSEMDYASIRDHRMIKLLHDHAQLRKREAAGRAKREELKSKPPKGQKPPNRKQTPAQERAALIQRAKRGDQNAKIAAISSLITGE